MKSDARSSIVDVSADLSFLSRLRFVTRHRRRGGAWGERRSTRRGIGLEFTDYRDYTPGDDLRRVDWNLYARLDRPYVRLYEEEENLAVSVLLDGSASMGWKRDDGGADMPQSETHARWPVAQQLTSALGAMVLLGGDRLRGALLQRGQVGHPWGPMRGRGYVAHWAAWVATLTTEGEARLGTALRGYATRPTRPGLALLLTDGYELAGLMEGVAALAGQGYEVVLLHLLTPEELNPSLLDTVSGRSDLSLIDSESEKKREVTINGAALAAYHHRLQAWQADLRALLGKHNGRYVLLRTDVPLRRMFLEDLRHARIVR